MKNKLMKNKLIKNTHILIPALILTVALAVSLAITAVRAEQYSRLVSVDGTVVCAQSTDDSDKATVQFAYTVRGTEYQGEYHTADSESVPTVGTVITVWYDPDAPEKAMHSKPSATLEGLCIMFIAVPLWLGIHGRLSGRCGAKSQMRRSRVRDIVGY